MSINLIGSQSSDTWLSQIQTYGVERTQPSMTDMISKMMENKDSNGDGGLGIDEIDISEEAFSLYDANADSLLDQDELSNAMEDMRGLMGPPPAGGGMQASGSEDEETSVEDLVAKMLEENDSDDDSALSIDETGFSEETFSLYDSNEDGVLDEDELTTALDASKEMMESHRQNGMMPPPPMEDSSENSTTQSSFKNVMSAYLSNAFGSQGIASNTYMGGYTNGFSLMA